MKIYRPEALAKIYQEELEIESGKKILTEVMEQKFDIIDLDLSLFQQYKEQNPILEVDIQKIDMADALVLNNDKYLAINLSSPALMYTLSEDKMFVDKSRPAVIVGGYFAIGSFLPSLVKLGFTNFIFLTREKSYIEKKCQDISRLFFNSKFRVLSFEDIDKIDETASLMIADVDFQKFNDFKVSLTYFNFLIQQAIFLDLRALADPGLTEEAERANLSIINIKTFIKYRYEMAKLSLKNRAAVIPE